MKDLIAVGLDGTLQSLSAALRAAREAELRNARLRPVHAWLLLAPQPTGAGARHQRHRHPSGAGADEPMHPARGPTGPCAGHARGLRLGRKAPHRLVHKDAHAWGS
ncbi:hypothetical protein ACWIG5_25870 [Streptomyces lydicus]